MIESLGSAVSKEPLHKSILCQGTTGAPRDTPGSRAANVAKSTWALSLEGLVLWPYENVPFGNVAPASWPAVAWASRPTFVRWIEHLHPVTDLAASPENLFRDSKDLVLCNRQSPAHAVTDCLRSCSKVASGSSSLIKRCK